MFVIYAIEDKILLKNEELNRKLSYHEVVLKHIRDKYIGKVSRIICIDLTRTRYCSFCQEISHKTEFNRRD